MLGGAQIRGGVYYLRRAAGRAFYESVDLPPVSRVLMEFEY